MYRRRQRQRKNGSQCRETSPRGGVPVLIDNQLIDSFNPFVRSGLHESPSASGWPFTHVRVNYARVCPFGEGRRFPGRRRNRLTQGWGARPRTKTPGADPAALPRIVAAIP